MGVGNFDDKLLETVVIAMYVFLALGDLTIT